MCIVRAKALSNKTDLQFQLIQWMANKVSAAQNILSETHVLSHTLGF